MILLGVRAAARRGVTVTITQDDPEKNLLPFNIASLNPIRLGTSDYRQIATALEIGWSFYRSQPDAYLDLPVFDAVRRLGDNYTPLEPDEQVLILRWFDPQYQEHVQDVLENLILLKHQGTSIVTTLDSRSPQLVEQRLYAAIRRTKMCIADFTAWRPNVLFETGVRLAVNETDPLMIWCEAPPTGWKNRKDSTWPKKKNVWQDVLRDFFQPVSFHVAPDGDLRLREFIDSFPGRPAGIPQPVISPGHTFHIVSDAIDRRAEPGGIPIDEWLVQRATMLAGPAIQEEGGLPVLFEDALADQVRQTAVECLAAAWYYLDGKFRLLSRLRDGTLPKDDAALEKLHQVGEELRARLRDTPGTPDQTLMKDLDDLDRAMRNM